MMFVCPQTLIRKTDWTPVLALRALRELLLTDEKES
jgi:hypothetical protein